ncbi:MAG: iron-sulfur cluster co-chaperone HscB C-terminal domain-containing protein [Planctomycetota bacterium]
MPSQSGINAFGVLGIPPSFEIEPARVEAAYLRRVAATHPDAMGAAALHSAPDADAETAALNDARTLLLDDERRANLVHDLLGGPSAESDRSLPDGFLVEVMEVRERAEDSAEVAAVREWARSRRSRHIDRVTALLRDPTAENLSDARTELNAWRYIERLLAQTDDPTDTQPDTRTDTRGEGKRAV